MIRPGVIKGWFLHETHDDRYFIMSGDIQVVMYDVGDDSPTCGQIFSVTLSSDNRQLLTIPANVWHGDRNVGPCDAVPLNMPTEPCQHKASDKYRLPLDTDLIPFSFGDPVS